MGVYLKRTVEIAVITFIGAAGASLAGSGGLDRASLNGAIAAGIAAVYAVLAKGLGDKDRPTVL